MDEGFPKEITYEPVRPKGFSSDFKEWPVDPMSSNQSWSPSDIIRFLLMLNQGCMDPYRSYFQLDVEVDPALLIGGVQIDGSAQSFINQLVITSNSAEVQRISQYDEIARILTDLGFSEAVAQGRDLQGMGMSEWVPSDSNRFPRGGTLNSFGSPVSSTATLYQMGSTGTVSPTKAFMSDVVGSYGPDWVASNNWAMTSDFSGSQVSMTSSWQNWNAGTPLPLNQNGFYNNLRAEYLSALSDDKYPQNNTSVVKGGIRLANINDPSKPYTVDFATNEAPYGRGGISNTTAVHGYNSAFSPYTGKGCYQPMLSNVIPQSYMQNGIILPQGVPIRKKTFLIPLISAIVGVLIPPDQYKLIPLKTLMNLLLQVTLNPYAMFSSGYQDRHEFDTVGMSRQIPRAFRITRFQYILNIYTFNGDSIRNYLESSIQRGISISCTSWMLGSQYQIPNGQIVRNSWQVNSTAASLAQVVIAFLANDYQQWAFCRKGFRLSNNVTSFQLKFNVNYYPPQPITGNAGNPDQVFGTADNANYYLLLLKSQSFLFNINMPSPRINRVNFAINDRCYDPSNKKTFAPLTYSTQGTSQRQKTVLPDTFNQDTALGMPYFHENRFCGKALYIYSFQPFAHSKEFTMGVDSRQARPFEVLFNVDPNNYFKRDQTMYIFLKHNIVVHYTSAGVVVQGR